MTDGKILGGMFTLGADGTMSATLSETMTTDKPLDKSSEEVTQVLKTVGFTDVEIQEIQEAEPADLENFDIFAELSTQEIDSILEDVTLAQEIISESEPNEEMAEDDNISEDNPMSDDGSASDDESI